MKETLIGILTSYYFWIAIEAIIIAVLLYFVVKYSTRNKALRKELETESQKSQYKELDEMLANNRSKR